MVQSKGPVEIYQLHILLLQINPPIWRHLHVGQQHRQVARLAPDLIRRPSSETANPRNRMPERGASGSVGAPLNN